MTKHKFFQAIARQGLALSFDDVRLRSGHSQVVAAEVGTGSLFSRRIKLKQPIVSSPMDTVTESKMAVAMALAGGLGVIHRGLTPAEQAHEVSRVKLYLNAKIERPICLSEDQTVQEAEDYRLEKGFGFQTFPVIDHSGKLVGLMTRNDFQLSDGPDAKLKDVMTPVSALLTASPGIGLTQAHKKMKAHKKKVLPLVSRTGYVKGMYIFSDVERIISGNQDGFNLDSAGHLRVAAAVGVGSAEIDRAMLLAERSVDAVVIDTAHGDSKKVIDTLKVLKRKIGRQVDIVAGNISEGQSAKRLVKAGADGLRVGQGPGSICTTRVIAGIGCPQVTAIYNCARAVEGTKVPICADGGINNSGDIPIAIGAGAHCVMLGRLLSGTDESPGELITIQGSPYKTYRGMGSLGAMESSRSSRDRYGQNSTVKDRLVPEGVEGAVPYKGPLKQVLHQYVEGLRRGMGYVGAKNVADLRKKAEFHRISASGLQESHPHHIHITKDAPNYNQT